MDERRDERGRRVYYRHGDNVRARGWEVIYGPGRRVLFQRGKKLRRLPRALAQTGRSSRKI